MYLLDTNVVSELRRKRPHGAVVAWFVSVAGQRTSISAVTVGEIQVGIENARQTDASKAAEIEAWLDHILGAEDILPMDAADFRLWAKLMHRKPPHVSEDAMIAATAQMRDLIVVTRNASDFQMFGVRTLNPFTTPR